MKRAREICELFVQFMKFGLFTFGGGWSIVAQMQKLYVEEKHTITAEELLDLTSVGRSVPGTMIGNVAVRLPCRGNMGIAGMRIRHDSSADGRACRDYAFLHALSGKYVGGGRDEGHSRRGGSDYDQRGSRHGRQRV